MHSRDFVNVQSISCSIHVKSTFRGGYRSILKQKDRGSLLRTLKTLVFQPISDPATGERAQLAVALSKTNIGVCEAQPKERLGRLRRKDDLTAGGRRRN